MNDDQLEALETALAVLSQDGHFDTRDVAVLRRVTGRLYDTDPHQLARLVLVDAIARSGFFRAELSSNVEPADGTEPRLGVRQIAVVVPPEVKLLPRHVTAEEISATVLPASTPTGYIEIPPFPPSVDELTNQLFYLCLNYQRRHGFGLSLRTSTMYREIQIAITGDRTGHGYKAVRMDDADVAEQLEAAIAWVQANLDQ